ncbi:MAG TPA: PEP-CTERM sorting domain-containing protein [Luteolibacter sp.]|nr:PEP-CTERM sorting domain-containing protein [Luteolibacter sp.]
MPKNPFPPSFTGIFAAGLLLAPFSQAAISLGVVQTYDAAGGDGVDTNASGNAIGSALPNDVVGFTTAVASAYTSNTGGVIDFGTTGSGNVGQMNITYGGTKTFAITSTIDYASGASPVSQTIDIRDNLSTMAPISGVTALLPNQANSAIGWTLNFGSISNGAVGEAITTAGFTLLSRTGFGQSLTVDWFINGNSTPVGSDTEAMASSSATDNTFFSYTAPAGSAITGFKINFTSGGNGVDKRLGIDDIGFITGVIPEPGSALLFGLASVTAMVRRRRI